MFLSTGKYEGFRDHLRYSYSKGNSQERAFCALKFSQALCLSSISTSLVSRKIKEKMWG